MKMTRLSGPAAAAAAAALLAALLPLAARGREAPSCGCRRLVNQAELDDGEFCVQPASQPGQVDVCYPLNWDGNCDSNKYKCAGEISLAACESTSYRNGAQPWDEVLCYQDMQRQYLQPTQGCPVELCINCDLSKCDGEEEEADYEACKAKEEWRCCMGKTECLDNQSPEECFDWKRSGKCGQVGTPLSCDVDCDGDAADPAACRTVQRMQCCVREAVECLLCATYGCQELCWEDKREECCAIVGIEDDETCNDVILWTTTTTTISSTTITTSSTTSSTTMTSTVSSTTMTSTVSSTTSMTSTSTVTTSTETTTTVTTSTATTTTVTTSTATTTTVTTSTATTTTVTTSTATTTTVTTSTATTTTVTTSTATTTTVTTTTITTTTKGPLVLLFRAQGHDGFRNFWHYWYNPGAVSSYGKQQAYDLLPLASVRFEDDQGRFAEFDLTGQYRGLTLLGLASQCIGGLRRNDGGTFWTRGLCPDVGPLVGSASLDGVSSVLRLGVGDSTGDRQDWALFMPLLGNGRGDFSGSRTWAFGSEFRTNTFFVAGQDEGEVRIYGRASV